MLVNFWVKRAADGWHERVLSWTVSLVVMICGLAGMAAGAGSGGGDQAGWIGTWGAAPQNMASESPTV